ncbi:c-type cytochrome [Povalibacter sp.]|uniref:c-type cytochrome n=1 Tax=Povalibacter sp. TaxID=1962978 RepID=UPI002F4164C8
MVKGKQMTGYVLGWVSPLAMMCAVAGVLPAAASPVRVDELVQRALRLDSNPVRGGRLYAQQCRSCHGSEALGDSARVIPALAGQRRAYLIKQLADFTEMERESADMHAVVARAAIREPQQWVDIAAYVNSLPVAAFPETGDGEGVELGEAIFQEQCASCHEEDARGDDDGFVPSLRNQHYTYLLRQTRGLASWHRHNVEPDLVRFLDSLALDELTAVADYLSRMRGPVRDRTRLDDDGTAGN